MTLRIRLVRVLLEEGDDYLAVRRMFSELLGGVSPELSVSEKDMRYTTDLITRQRCYDLKMRVVKMLHEKIERSDETVLSYIDSLKKMADEYGLQVKVI